MATYAELVYRARAGDPEAIKQLGWDREQSSMAAPYQADPYLANSMMNMYMPTAQFTDEGEPKWQNNLNLFQDYVSEQADPVTAGMVGGAGLDPAALEPTQTWEPLKQDFRQELSMYAGGGDWQSVIADGLLKGLRPQEAIQAARQMAQEGTLQLPMQQQDAMSSRFGAQTEPLVDEQALNDFAVTKFEGLAKEADPTQLADQGLARQRADGTWEMQGEPEPSALAAKYKSLGLPLPTDEYSMDWLRSNAPGLTNPADFQAADVMSRNAEQQALAKAAMAERGQNRENREADAADMVMRAAGRVPQAPVPFLDVPNEPFKPLSGDFDYRNPVASAASAGFSTPEDTPEEQAARAHLMNSYGNSELQGQDFLNREWNRQQRDQASQPGLIESMLGVSPVGGPPKRNTNQTRAQDQFNSPEQRRRRKSNMDAQHQSMESYDKNAIAMYLLAQAGRRPYVDAMQARTQPMMQAGVLPAWGG